MMVTSSNLLGIETAKGSYLVGLIVRALRSRSPCQAWDTHLSLRRKICCAGGGGEDTSGRSKHEAMLLTTLDICHFLAPGEVLWCQIPEADLLLAARAAP